MTQVRLARAPRQRPEPGRFRGFWHCLRPNFVYHRYLCNRVTQTFTFYVIIDNNNALRRCNTQYNIVNILWYHRLKAQFAVVENHWQNCFMSFKGRHISIVTTAVINPGHTRHTFWRQMLQRHARLYLVRFCLRLARTIFQRMVGRLTQKHKRPPTFRSSVTFGV